MTVDDAKRVAGGRLGGRAELPGCDDRGRHIERGLGHGDEQLQRHRALGLMIVEARAVRRRGERGVAREVRVNFVGAMVLRIAFVQVHVHERSTERSQRDGHRQPDRGQRSNHTVIVRETNRTVKPERAPPSY